MNDDDLKAARGIGLGCLIVLIAYTILGGVSLVVRDIFDVG